MPTSSTSQSLYIIAIGGPTCSGKTTLAKHLARILPNSTSLFQDDFAPPIEKIPKHPVHDVQDWDDPETAIEWPRQRETLKYIRQHNGEFPSAHLSHDSFNAQIPVPISPSLQSSWSDKFSNLVKEKDELKFVIADGFLMLVDLESVKEFDVRLFVREDYEVLKKRREERFGYHTAVESDPEGALWTDPPEYWDKIVWPAYLKAHRPLFESENVESGHIDSTKIQGVEILEANSLSMDELVENSCRLIYDRVKEGKKVDDWEKP